MSRHDPHRQNNLIVMLDILSAIGEFYVWQYLPDGQLVSTTCPHEMLEELMIYEKAQSSIFEHGRTNREPCIIWTNAGFLWVAAFDWEKDQLQKMYILGPMNSVENDYTMRKNRYLQVPLSMKSEIEKLYEGFPPMSLSGVIRICLMLHRAVTGETVQQDQIAFPLRSSKEPLQPSHCETVAKGRSKDRMVNYMAQDAVLQNIRDGNLNYHEDYNRLVHIGTGTKVETENAIERGRLSVVSFISLCMQAAIQGGVLPDVAYSRGDMYTQEVLRAKTYGDLVDVSHTMYEDLLLCVHELHVNKQVSPTIQACCNYIREYVDTDLSIRSLADRLGYSEYYLSRKFSKEMGVSISYYIRAAKVERAKVLLRCTSDSIEKISDDLFFCTRNYFTYCFNSIVNMSPNEYRKKYQRQ